MFRRWDFRSEYRALYGTLSPTTITYAATRAFPAALVRSSLHQHFQPGTRFGSRLLQ